MCSPDLVEKMLKIKQADDHREESEKLMFRLKNIIIMDEYDALKTP